MCPPAHHRHTGHRLAMRPKSDAYAIATDLWDDSGVPLAALAPDTVMRVEHLVDASLAAFDQGESVTLPSMADTSVWQRYDTARSELFTALQTATPAPRLLAT